MLTLLTRTMIIYILLLITMRILGKRQLGELQASELVITFMLSELAVTPIQNQSIPLSHAVAPVVLLVSVEVILSYLLLHCAPLKRLLCEKPSILVRGGVIDEKELKRQRISVTELLSELRQKDVAELRDVEYAILEENGKLSVFLKAEKRPATVEELGVEPSDSGLAHPVIIDGVISAVNMELSHTSDKEIERELAKRKLRVKQVLLMTVDDKKEFHVIKRGAE
ncbi:MAG: DUF421 domain-containing protein [Clostridia bacterium]|nr:DUF421 domain-containing protein [Clostridia bacterium]MBO5295621.1 DUF421 domain-containing protein [Clostridia bacterium]